MKNSKVIMLICASLFFLCGTVWADDTVTEFRKRSSDRATEISESDIEAEIQFGEELAARILGRFRAYDNEKATRYINLIGKGLASYSNRPEIEFRFAILNTDSINAFAAPGGFIFITKGTLEMVENEAQLAGVLAHEIAHITEKHIVKELNIKGGDESPLAGFASILGGGTSETMRVALTQLVDKAGEILFEKGLKKEDELTSDKVALMTVTNAGYDPVAYKRLLQGIKEKEEGTEKTKIVSTTHPSYEDRIKAMEKIISREWLNELKYLLVKERFDEYINL
ncbi:MAG: M48 family metalloprotease [Proteobacteria bacterium]|nr:M48 family metalloprotease [Pseudomonadota bacterium]